MADQEVVVSEQVTISTENQFVWRWLRVDGLSQVHAKVLNDRFRCFINDTEIESLGGNVEIGFYQQRRQQHCLPIIKKAVLGNPVRGQHVGELIFQLQQVPDRVAILRDRQATSGAVFLSVACPRGSHDLPNSLGQRLSLTSSRLLLILRGHGACIDLFEDVFPEKQLSVFERAVQVI